MKNDPLFVLTLLKGFAEYNPETGLFTATR